METDEKKEEMEAREAELLTKKMCSKGTHYDSIYLKQQRNGEVVDKIAETSGEGDVRRK